MELREKHYYILITGLLLGFFIVLQSRSFQNVSELNDRDIRSNIFQEIQILKERNADLEEEVENLEDSLDSLDNRGQALESIEDEIDKYKKLAGGAKIFGSGVELMVDGDITTAWIIDLVNELFNNGAEAVSVNGIRLVNNTMGFDTLPQGQILLNGSITPPPYTFEAIGEPRTIESALQLPGGILDRLQRNFDAVKVEVVTKDIIRMD